MFFHLFPFLLDAYPWNVTTLKVVSSLLYSLLTKYPDNGFGFSLTKKKWGKGWFITWHHQVPIAKSMRKSSYDIFSQTWEREQSSPAALPYPRQVSQGFPSPLVPNYFKCVIMIFIKYNFFLWFTSSSWTLSSLVQNYCEVMMFIKYTLFCGLRQILCPLSPLVEKYFNSEMEYLSVINQYD